MSIRTHLLAAVLPTLVATPWLAAQRPAPATVILKDPIATLHIDGPAALRAAFLPTNLGRMFAGPEFKEMTAPFLQMWDGMKKQGEMPFDPQALEQAVLNYRGRLSVAFHLLDEKIDFKAPEPPDFSLTIALTPDGKTDLAGLCKAVEKLAKDQGQALIAAKSGDHTIHYVDDGDMHVSLPFLFEDHAVMLLSTNMEIAADRQFAADAAMHTPDPTFATANVGLRVHASQAIKLLEGAARQENEWESVLQHIFNRSGLKSLQNVDITYRAQGPALLSELVATFNQNDRGLLGILMPVQAERSKLIDTLPRTAVTASAIPFDLKKLYDVVKSVFADIGDAAPMSFDDLLADFKDHYDLRLKEDVVDTIGRGLFAVSMESDDDPDAANPFGSLDGMTVGIGLADGKKFKSSLDTMLRREGLHAGRRRTEYEGFDIYNLSILGMVDFNYAVTDSLFVFGAGPAGGDAIKSTLDQIKAQAAGAEPGPLPAPVRQRVGMVKGNYQGLGWTDVGTSVEGLLGQLTMLPPGMPPQVDMVLDIARQMPKMMRKYQVQHQVTVIRAKGNTWKYQNIW